MSGVSGSGQGKQIIFYMPSPSVFAISITGKRCELACPHCDGKYLEGMVPATMPPDVIRAFDQAKKQGAKCVLVSGGFNRKGRLPIERVINAIKEGKARTGLIVEVHSGVVDNATILALGQAGVDALLLDVIGDEVTIREYLGGNWSVEDYRRVLNFAKGVIPTVAPHVLIGVDSGSVRGEYKAIDLISESDVSSCALLVLVNGKTLDPAEVEKVMKYAREKLLGVHLTLGCMRGKGAERLLYEKMAINLSFDGIANPSKEATDYAFQMGLQARTETGCCIFLIES